jgi:hypothetical protein
MLKLQEVLDFIQNSELAEFNKIRFAVDRKRSELRNDKKESFRIGDTVGIDHRRVNKNDQFKVIKVNSKTITVEKLNVGNGRIGAQMRVSPSLLFKK